jgi:Protein of unknown function (DUF429)
VLTVGVDLAAEPVNTAVARIRGAAGGAQVQALAVGADDVLLAEEIAAADKAGIDCPLVWPRRFVEFLAQHQAGQFVTPVDVAGKDWRRRLALRETDLVTRDLTRLVPLSVATDRIGLAAMRCAGLLVQLTADARPVDRTGTGSAYAFAIGASGGIFRTATPAAVNTASKAALNLASRSQIRNRNPSARSPNSISRLRAAWVTQSPVG